MKNWKLLLVILVIAALFTGGVIWRTQSEKVKLNTNYVNGNTSGNLYNAGLFCESNGTVFFANPDDHNRLYSMDSDGSNLSKVCNDSAMYINADSNYIYYVRDNDKSNDEIYGFFSFHNNSLCRIDRDGKNLTVLDEAPCLYASLIGNYIYYLHYDTESATTLYKIKIDGTERKKLSNQYQFTCNSVGQYFYYNDMFSDGSIVQYDTATDTASVIYHCNSYKPIVTNDANCFYLDVDQNNALVHVNLNAGTPTVLTTDSIDLYNVYGSNIYYQTYDTNNNPALCMIRDDGSEAKMLMPGTFQCINVTSYYIYFTDYYSGTVFYTPTANPGVITDFHPGRIED